MKRVGGIGKDLVDAMTKEEVPPVMLAWRYDHRPGEWHAVPLSDPQVRHIRAAPNLITAEVVPRTSLRGLQGEVQHALSDHGTYHDLIDRLEAVLKDKP